jgi:hypothetical protein
MILRKQDEYKRLWKMNRLYKKLFRVQYDKCYGTHLAKKNEHEHEHEHEKLQGQDGPEMKRHDEPERLG